MSLTTMFTNEPVLTVIFGNTAFWNALFPLTAAFGHPFSDAQQHAILGLTTVVAALLVRSQVSPKATTAAEKETV